ncbi:MAG TPA: hypothetical protein VE957_01320, partial [Terriglobales bacterium]|nr:hypothetical protein [Terriglobales bacterium]
VRISPGDGTGHDHSGSDFGGLRRFDNVSYPGEQGSVRRRGYALRSVLCEHPRNESEHTMYWRDLHNLEMKNEASQILVRKSWGAIVDQPSPENCSIPT